MIKIYDLMILYPSNMAIKLARHLFSLMLLAGSGEVDAASRLKDYST
jgi:hypothetical protein